MSQLDRRTFLKVLGAATAGTMASPVMRALAGQGGGNSTEYFVFIHAHGGWDVTLWSDPRNQNVGIVNPPSTVNSDTSGIRHWVNAPLDGMAQSFQIVTPPNTSLQLGPAIGNLYDMVDRLCIVNGLTMNTVSHPDGTCYAVTGRHLAGGSPVSPSGDTVVASSLGVNQLFPVVAVQYPSAFIGQGLDQRAIPIIIDDLGVVGDVLTRSAYFELDADRADVAALLAEEARSLGQTAYYPATDNSLKVQYASVQSALSQNLSQMFNSYALAAKYPQFGALDVQYQTPAAFLVDAFARDLVRCVSLSLGSFDTHFANYKNHAIFLQQFFDALAAILATFDKTPHPSIASDKLSEHVHFFVTSDFCRTPGINPSGGRDHYPNNSGLIISPKFKGKLVFGQSDPGQLLPAAVPGFSTGPRPVAPPDLLATFVHAFGIEPSGYFRDGEVIAGLLA